MSPPRAVLTATNLSKRYRRRRLFEGLSFSVADGERVAVVGPNGSGKSTLVQILAGVVAQTKGTVGLTIGETSVPAEERAFHVGLVGPYLNVYEGLSARENLAFVARLRGISTDPQHLDAYIGRVGLAGREDDLVKTFSSGMKQRIKLATALLVEPAILLLDEPGATLDETGRTLVRDLLHTHAGPLILATNDPAEAALCPRTIDLGAPRGREL
ncbi:MAG: ABC transporter ATP-binding protein [Bacteroidota bacterium]